MRMLVFDFDNIGLGCFNIEIQFTVLVLIHIIGRREMLCVQQLFV